MAYFWRTVATAVLLGLLAGVWWSSSWSTNGDAESDEAHRLQGKLRVLALRSYVEAFPTDALTRQTGVEVVWQAARTPKELFDRSHNSRQEYDLIQVFSYQLETLRNSKVLRSYAPRLTDLRDRLVHPDFRSLPEGYGDFFFPVGWGVQGFAKSQVQAVETWSFSRNPYHLYQYLKARQRVFDNWLESDQTQRIVTALAEVPDIDLYDEQRARTSESMHQLFTQQPGTAFSMNQAEFAAWVEPSDKREFVLDPQHNSVWLLGWGLGRQPSDEMQQAIAAFFEYQMQDSVAQQTVNMPVASTSVDFVKRSSEMLGPSYLRQIPLSTIRIETSHPAYQSTWIKALESRFPNWKQDAEDASSVAALDTQGQ